MTRFGILGPLTVVDETRDIAISGLRRRSLLLRLLVSANHPVSAQRLIEDLWEGEPPPGAFSTLQSHLSYLRRAIGHNMVKHVPSGYQLKLGQGDLDAQAFEAESRDGRRLLSSCDFDEASELLGSALSLWRGPALSDVNETMWALPEASRLEEVYLVTREAMHDALLAQGRHLEVVETAQSAVVENPLRETLWGQLMLALYRCGRQADALHAYQRLRAHLSELGLEPKRELVDLENAILLQASDLDWISQQSEVKSRLSPPQRLTTSNGHVPLPERIEMGMKTFVGRKRELGLIDGLFREALTEKRPRIALIAGEPGIGKTSLAATAARAAYLRGAAVLYGRCDPYLGIPYQPWREALLHLIEHSPERISDEAMAPGGVIQTLGLTPHASFENSSPGATDIYLLFQAVLAILATFAEPSGLTVVLDDLHWSDVQGVQLLRRLMTGTTRSPILVIATYRDSEVELGSAIGGLISDLSREPGVLRIDLVGLGDNDVLALVEAQTNRPLGTQGTALCHELMEETDGNPFFIGELLRHLDERGLLDDVDPSDWFIKRDSIREILPPNVNEVIRERVAHLGGGAAETLLAASVVGREFDLGLVALVRGIPINEALDHLDSAVGACFIDDFGGGRFAFTHSLVARSLYSSVSPTRQALIHAEVARAIEQEYESDRERAAELAHHWIRASISLDVKKALSYAQIAADYALAHLAPDDARSWYVQALELLSQASTVDEHMRCELLVGLGDSSRQCGDPAHREILLDAARLAIDLQDDELLIRAALANSRGFFAEAGHVDKDRVEILLAAADRTRTRHDDLRGKLLAVLAAELTFDDDSQLRRDTADEAMSIARRIGDPTTLLWVLNHRIFAVQGPDTLNDALADTSEALDLVKKVDNLSLSGLAAGCRYVVAWQACDVKEADRMWQIMEQTAATLGQPTSRWFVAFLASHRAMVAADLDESERLADDALKIGTETGQPDAFNIYGAQVLRINRERDRGSDFVPLLEQVVDEDPQDATAATMLARLYCDAASFGKAERCISKYLDSDYEIVSRNVFWTTIMSTIADTVADLGLGEAAAHLLPHLLPYSNQWDWIGPSSNGPVARPVARLAALLGDHELAESQFRLSLALSENFISPLYRAHTLLDWARASSPAASRLDENQKRLDECKLLATNFGLVLVERLATDAG